jgi:hypothetical protein
MGPLLLLLVLLASIQQGNLHSNRTEVIEFIMIFGYENQLEFEMTVS